MNENTTDPIVVLRASDLRAIIRDEFENVLVELDEDRLPVKPLLDSNQCAQALSTSRTTIDRLVRQGMPFVRLGEVRRYDFDEVLTWLRNRE